MSQLSEAPEKKLHKDDPRFWKIKTIGEICSFSNGNGFSARDWSALGLPIIRIQNLNGSKNFNYFAGTPQDRWVIEPGTLLFAWAGVKGVSFGPTIWDGPTGVLNQHIYKITPSKDIDKYWLYCALKVVTTRIEGQAHGFKSSLLHVQKSDITSQQIAVPPLEEQRKIVEILSTWDKAIEQQTRLLELKRERKRGLMQQLLTGKVRFKEFEGLEWKTYTFNELAKQRSRKFDPQDVGEARRCIELEHIEQGTGRLLGWVDSSQQASTKNVFQVGDVLFGKLRPYLRKFWHAQFDGVCTTEAWVLVPSNLLDTGFLLYLVQSQEFMAAANVSSGSKMPRAEWKYLAEVPFTVPPFQEQQKIAAVLSAADAELETLEKQLSALRTQKRGLMQQLLTGKTRVKIA